MELRCWLDMCPPCPTFGTYFPYFKEIGVGLNEITMLSLCECVCECVTPSYHQFFNAMTSLYETWYVYHGM
jgi:hypothetical protein